MKNKKTMILSIVGILVMLLSIIGVTYAWFNANIDGEGSKFNVTTAIIGPLTYSGSEITAENVLPGWISEDADLKVEGTVTTEDTVGYICSIENTGEVTDVEYRISLDGEETSENAEWKSINDNPIVSGGISASNTSDEYKIAVRFKETGEDQNSQQNKTLSVNVVCEVKDMFTVTMVGVNGTTTPIEKAVVPNGSVEFDTLPTEGYTSNGAAVTCDNGAVGSISNNIITISNVTNNNTCTVEYVLSEYEVEVNSTNTNYGTVTPTSTKVSHGSSATFTLNPASGYKYSSNTCGGTVSGNTLTISNITAAKTCTVTFEYGVTFTLETSGSYDTTYSATTGAACYYVRNYYGGYNYTPTTTTFSYTYDGTTYNNCKISGTPTCKVGSQWSSGTSFDCASHLFWLSGSGYWLSWYGTYGHSYAGCSATVTCS